MTTTEVIEMLKTEKACVERQDRKPQCNRYCESCDLCMPIEKVLEGYKLAIQALEQTQDRPTGHWIWQTEDKYQCSCCGEVIRVKEVMGKPQYITCPMCDAKMGVE